MRWLVTLVLAIVCTCSALAAPAAFNAGVIRLTVVDEAAPFDTDSAGGYTALILAGAKPDFASASAYCANHDDPGSCPRSASSNGANGIQGKAVAPNELMSWQPPVDRRLKAFADGSAAMMFKAPGLSAVRVPTMLFRSQDDSYLGSARNTLAVVSGLPTPPAVHVLPGNHFVFIDPCPASVAVSAAPICQDAPGVDRVEIHHQIDQEVVDFLRANL